MGDDSLETQAGEGPLPATGEGSVHVVTCSFCHQPYVIVNRNGCEYYCRRCGQAFPDEGELEQRLRCSHMFSLLGLGLIIPAFILPMLIVEQFGVRTEAGFLIGLQRLWMHGDYFLAVIIGLCSGVFPLLKLGGMVFLTTRAAAHMGANRLIYKTVSFLGKWGMLDVFFSGILIFAFKFNAAFRIDVKSRPLGMRSITS